jgi:hypothetical protein
MAQETKHWLNESDIGSGEKPPSQKDVERDERRVNDGAGNNGQARSDDRAAAPPGRMLQSGTHLARILAVRQPDDTFEAQVFVRLTREPEIAETYIPAGTFATESEAWAAAEERAKRAFAEREF